MAHPPLSHGGPVPRRRSCSTNLRPTRGPADTVPGKGLVEGILTPQGGSRKASSGTWWAFAPHPGDQPVGAWQTGLPTGTRHPAPGSRLLLAVSPIRERKPAPACFLLGGRVDQKIAEKFNIQFATTSGTLNWRDHLLPGPDLSLGRSCRPRLQMSESMESCCPLPTSD